MLLEQMPGIDGYGADEQEQIDMVSTLVDIQIAASPMVESLVTDGVPDLRAAPLGNELAELIARLAPGSRPLNRLIDQLPERFAAAAECGVPDTLVHGDPHGGNCRTGGASPVWFDWGDSFVGNPLLDIAALERTELRMSRAAIDRWIDRWAEAVPSSDPRSSCAELEPIAALRMAWVYQRLLDNIEPSERIYHRDDVPQALSDVEAMLSPS